MIEQPQKRILLADDQQLFADSAVALIAKHWPSADVQTVSDHKQLLDIVRSRPPFDVVVLDLRMPGPSEIDPIEVIHRHSGEAAIILISGSADAVEIGRALSAGADAFVHKNQGGEDLITTLEKFLTGRAEEETAGPGDSLALRSGSIRFSKREFETLKLISDGRSTKEIAQELKIAPATVKVYIKSLLKKTGCPTRTALAVFALREDVF